MNKLTMVVAVALLFLAGSVSADVFQAKDVTIPDGRPNNNFGTEQYPGYWAAGGEDNEVEYNNQTGQQWDMEAFRWHWQTSTLYLVTGFNPAGTISYSGTNMMHYVAPDGKWSLGDIWITSQDGSKAWVLAFARQTDTNPNNPGWGNAYMNLDTTNKTFTVYEVAPGFANQAPVAYNSPTNWGSNPYAFLTGTEIQSLGSGNYGIISYTTNQAGYESLPYLGADSNNTHYVMDFDLTPWIGTFGSAFYVQATEECGNDLIKGQVPEPISMAMAGAGLFGVIIGRRKLRKNA